MTLIDGPYDPGEEDFPSVGNDPEPARFGARRGLATVAMSLLALVVFVATWIDAAFVGSSVGYPRDLLLIPSVLAQVLALALTSATAARGALSGESVKSRSMLSAVVALMSGYLSLSFAFLALRDLPDEQDAIAYVPLTVQMVFSMAICVAARPSKP